MFAEEDSCLAYNGEGIAYQEFTCVHPELDRFYLS
jgi:hypothetical protein